jgi:hypothetical protein
MKTFARIGKSIFIIGLVLTIAGLIFGFGLLIFDEDKWALRFLMAVPIGFVFLFTGLATSVIFSPRDDSDLNEKRSLQDFHDDL